MLEFLYFVAGLLTAYLMYGSKERIPVFKALIVILFGYFSLFVWCIGNFGSSIQNPPHKKDCC